MTLLIMTAAAIAVTLIWYFSRSENKLGTLALMYWGASLMWFVDAIAGYIEDGADFFVPAADEMLNDTYLGFSAVVLGLVIWTGILLFKDPKGRISAILKK